MSGYVLIIDAMSNRRIHLRSRLDTVAYQVDLAETQAEGLAKIRQDAPDVVIIADDLPGLKLRQFCRALRASPVSQLTTVVVAVRSENHSARVSALNDGAHDVIDQTADATDLKARMRSFLRSRQFLEDTRAHRAPQQAHGMSEAIPEFAPRIIATIVCAASFDKAEINYRFGAETGIETRLVAARAARRAPDEDSDVFVLVESDHTDEARETLAALLTHPVSRHSRILFVTDRTGKSASPLDLGAHDQVPTTVTQNELALRIHRLARRKRDADRQRKAATELEHKAYVDALTGLNNRTALDEYLIGTDRALAVHPRQVAVLIADLDHFKAINDNHGHAAGDVVLVHVAQTMKAHLRDGDFIARYGGEEFLIVLPDVTPAQARSVANRLRDAVADSPKAIKNGTYVRATISIGIAVAQRNQRVSTTALCFAADRALYDAKRNGRNRIEVSQGAIRPAIPEHRMGA